MRSPQTPISKPLHSTQHHPKHSARDIPSREFLPYLANYLKETDKCQLIESKCPSNLMQVKEWYYEIAASTLYQYYLNPSFPQAFNKSRGGSQDNQRVQAKNEAHAVSLHQFIKIGWIIKDRTGIIYLSSPTINLLDMLADQIIDTKNKPTSL